jgi:hypothetical protein
MAAFGWPEFWNMMVRAAEFPQALNNSARVGSLCCAKHIFHMNAEEQINKYINSQPEPKRSDMQELHRIILQVMPACKLWFLDGKDSENKTVSNPNIGYGLHTIEYADGTTREFYQIGLSANKTGISIYILGIKDRKYLAQTYGKDLGKASVTGYCIRFKTLKDINIEILEAAIRYGFEAQNEKGGLMK